MNRRNFLRALPFFAAVPLVAKAAQAYPTTPDVICSPITPGETWRFVTVAPGSFAEGRPVPFDVKTLVFAEGPVELIGNVFVNGEEIE